MLGFPVLSTVKDSVGTMSQSISQELNGKTCIAFTEKCTGCKWNNDKTRDEKATAKQFWQKWMFSCTV